MKKLPALLNTPARVVIAVGLIILLGEFSIMLLIESIHTTIMKDVALEKVAFEFIDPILLIAIVSPALYILILRPMRKQQTELEDARKKIGQAFQEWIAALDVVNDPIFLHDKNFRILRCNKAYQQCAGFPFHEIIGQPYYTIFPKNHEPLPSCRRAMEKAEEEEEEEEEVTAGGAIYRSRAFSVKDEQGAYLYSIHTIEDITGRKQAEEKLRLHGEIERNMAEAVYLIRVSDGVIVHTNPIFDRMFGYEPGELVGKHVSIVNAPGDKGAEAVANEIIGSLMRTGVWNGEVHNIRKDGATFWCHANVFTFEHPQYGRVWLSMHQDITERKQAEAKLAEQLEELRGWHDVTLGREMRIIELKHEVDELLAQAGQPPRYPNAESDDQQESKK